MAEYKTPAQIISFEDRKMKMMEGLEDQKNLSELKQKQKEMTHYKIGGTPSVDMTESEYVNYLCSDLDRSNRSYFYNRWLSYLKRHPKVKVADLVKENGGI